MFAEEIILIIYGEKYLPSVQSLKIIAFAIPALFNISGHILRGMDKQKEITKILIYTFAVNLAFNIILIHFFSMIGAAIAVIITQYFLNFQYYLYLKKNNILSFKKTRSVVCTTFAISAFCVLAKTYIINFHILYIELPIITITFFVFIFLFIAEKKDFTMVKKIFIK